MVAAPLALHHFSVADDFKGERIAVVEVPSGEHDLPQAAEGIIHHDAAFANPELNAFSPLGVILQLNFNGHIVSVYQSEKLL